MACAARPQSDSSHAWPHTNCPVVNTLCSEDPGDGGAERDFGRYPGAALPLWRGSSRGTLLLLKNGEAEAKGTNGLPQTMAIVLCSLNFRAQVWTGAHSCRVCLQCQVTRRLNGTSRACSTFYYAGTDGMGIHACVYSSYARRCNGHLAAHASAGVRLVPGTNWFPDGPWTLLLSTLPLWRAESVLGVFLSAWDGTHEWLRQL